MPVALDRTVKSAAELYHEQQHALSPLMRAKAKYDSLNIKVNFCPFGCTDKNLDENGYCHHLIGFCDNNNPDFYEPMMRVKGKRVVRVNQVEEPGQEDVEPYERSTKPKLERCRASDVKVQITTCSRVYRDVPNPKAITQAATV